jgi:hypothetical protein
MEWIGCIRCENFQRNFVHRTCAFMVPVRPVLHRLSCSNETVRNNPKHEFGSNGVDRVRSLRKILTQVRLANLCVNGVSSASFA